MPIFEAGKIVDLAMADTYVVLDSKMKTKINFARTPHDNFLAIHNKLQSAKDSDQYVRIKYDYMTGNKPFFSAPGEIAVGKYEEVAELNRNRDASVFDSGQYTITPKISWETCDLMTRYNSNASVRIDWRQSVYMPPGLTVQFPVINIKMYHRGEYARPAKEETITDNNFIEINVRDSQSCNSMSYVISTPYGLVYYGGATTRD